jgi:hypothetical protein
VSVEAYASAKYESMSPTMLASQPSEIDEKDLKKGKDWVQIYSALESRLGSLRMWRYSFWQYWSELAQYILPQRYHFLVTANTMNKGHPVNGAIVDGTATLAMRICAAGLWTGLTSPSRPWFKLGVPEGFMSLDADGAAWLEDTERRCYDVLGGSNFYNTMAQAFQDVATFGTAPVIMYEDFEDVIRCYLPCAGEYYLGVGGRLSVDVHYREYVQTVQSLVDQFGLEHCPAQVVKAWTEGGASLDLEFVVAHAIEPNTALKRRGAPGEIRVVPGVFTWREVYWLKGIKTDAELSRRGFNEVPFFVARWSTTSNDPYGRSPGMDALGDTKQLQMETRRKGEFIEKIVRPPMGADVEMKNEPSSILPGHITYTNTQGGKKGFWPLFEMSPAALAPMVADIKEIQERIKTYFFVDVFMAISQMEGVQPRNELELTKRDLERLQVLGPFITLFETEFANPGITRLLAILERRRLLKPRPQSMQGVPIQPKYMSILKLAQRAAETANLERTFATAGNLSAAAKAAGVADPIRVIDLDKAFREYADLLSVSPAIFYSPDVVAEHDQARTQAQQTAMAAQTTLPAVTAAKTLSETNVGGGQSALSAMLGGGQQ